MVDALALASLMLTSGTAGDRYAHKRVVLTGLAVFGAGTLGCGLAQRCATSCGAHGCRRAGDP
ncbi:hypothetical protein [Streptomyces collinus]|uniref:hypothetical protein n=1 Tax=Streptomyces collinus TaxID=42684 RepID=UPI00294279DD|nr:hypothetical protein [Streptomyces collinus]